MTLLLVWPDWRVATTEDGAQPEAPQMGARVRVAGDEADANVAPVPPVKSH
jgi:hypothetical protein